MHVPVLADRIVDYLRPVARGVLLDGTLGGGGHFRRLLRDLSPTLAIGMDRDLETVARTALSLRDEPGPRLFAWGNFRSFAATLAAARIRALDGILVDFGLSSLQLSAPRRGFSFSADGPLDMRMDRHAGPSAADLLRTLPETRIRDILRDLGEERHAGRLARAIVAARGAGAIDTTAKLRSLVHGTIGARSGKIDSATRTFQALRIAVNGEIDAIEAFLPEALRLLRPGGRCCMITFHSLEDRPVKRFVRREARDCLCDGKIPACVCGHRALLRDLTPHPEIPDEAEVAANPRARSAKLRVFEKR